MPVCFEQILPSREISTVTGMPHIGPYASCTSSWPRPCSTDVVHLELLHERHELLVRVVDRDADDLQTRGAVLLLELDEPRNLDLAGSAPRRPEVEKDDLSLEVRRGARPGCSRPST